MNNGKDKILIEILSEMKLIWVLIPIEALAIYILLKTIPSTFSSKIPFINSLLVTGQANAGSISFFLFLLFMNIVFFLAIYIAFKRLYRRWLLETHSDFEKIRSMSWHDFELLVGQVFRKQGYEVEERGGTGPDGGVDLILYKGKIKTVVQCKHWKSWTVGVSLVRELLGAMTAEKASSCIFITSGSFTPDAITFAQDKPIQLIDGIDLIDMIQEENGERDKKEPQGNNVEPFIPHCPLCNSLMIKKDAKKGVTAGTSFWGCSNWPECKGSRPYNM